MTFLSIVIVYISTGYPCRERFWDNYIIENYVINASKANGIDIRNTTAYFVIRNCLVENGGGETLPDVTEKASLIVGGFLTMQHSEISGSGGIKASHQVQQCRFTRT
jgi:hypothetical protein